MSRRWWMNSFARFSIGLAMMLSVVPISAQPIPPAPEMQRPYPAQEGYRGRPEDYRGRPEEPRERLPPSRSQRGGKGGWDELRARMFELRSECEAGERRACIQFGIIIGENRERRAQWRREQPDLFWWDR